MCIITAEELEAERLYWLNVTKTNIFARHARAGYQAIAYSLSIASKSAAAMILPLPVVPGSGEDALMFIDLSGYEEFFDDLSRVCEPELIIEVFDDLGVDDTLGLEDTLIVHEVGDYEASYVPTMRDFSLLDPRFRLPAEIWQKMPDYSNYGFAVFQLKLALTTDSEEAENTVHPMAFEFRTRDVERLYFPTVHVHDGDFHDEAGFYHRFYCQREHARAEFKAQRELLGEHVGGDTLPGYEESDSLEIPTGQYEWYFRSTEPAAAILPVDRTQGIIDPHAKLHSMSLQGDYPNQDIWLGGSLLRRKIL